MAERERAWTPGPWSFGRDVTYEFGEWEIDYPNSCSYRHVGATSRPDAPVALVTGLLSRDADIEIDANARLIAAAPEQNEALAMVAEKLPIMPDPDAGPEEEIEIALTWREVSQIKHALAKAQAKQRTPQEASEVKDA